MCSHSSFTLDIQLLSIDTTTSLGHDRHHDTLGGRCFDIRMACTTHGVVESGECTILCGKQQSTHTNTSPTRHWYHHHLPASQDGMTVWASCFCWIGTIYFSPVCCFISIYCLISVCVLCAVWLFAFTQVTLLFAISLAAGSVFYAISPQHGAWVCHARLWVCTVSHYRNEEIAQYDACKLQRRTGPYHMHTRSPGSGYAHVACLFVTAIDRWYPFLIVCES